jgi:hypothetical protein
MKTLKSALVVLASLATFSAGAVAQEPDRAPGKAGQAPTSADPATPAPTQPPPPPPAVLPKPPAEQPPVTSQDKPAADGQWVYTSQYGWVWMPYGDKYAHVPQDGSPPNMYVYYPDAGWCWVVAPWLWGWGPAPFFGVLGPRFFGWWGIGFGHWYGFAGPYAHWGWHGRAYWGGGRWNGVTRSYGGLGRGGSFRGGGGFSRGMGRGLHR